jgi:anti-sigma factor RsiW
VSQCEVNISRIDLYLDDELAGCDLEVFNRHIRECSSCHAELIERRRFLERIRAVRPLYPSSPKLRAEVAAVLEQPVGPRTVAAPGRPVTRIAGKSRACSWLTPSTGARSPCSSALATSALPSRTSASPSSISPAGRTFNASRRESGAARCREP